MYFDMKKFILAAAMAAVAPALLAVPAKRDVVRTLEQPDGTTVQVTVVGDEFAHVYRTLDNLPLMLNQQGFYCYAVADESGLVLASDVPARDIALRSASDIAFISSINAESVGQRLLEQKLQRSPMRAAENTSAGKGLYHSDYPTTGSPKSLVILAQFTDVKFSVENPADFYDRYFHGEDFHDYNIPGSIDEYFRLSSNGNFTPQFDVYGPVTLSNNQAYYGANGYNGDARAHECVYDACVALDGEINFADYDTDGDGVVDNIYVIYAGQGESDYGSANTIWPHSWNLEYGLGYRPKLDDVYLSRYGVSNEWAFDAPAGPGIYVHEFGHVIGLADHYDVNYGTVNTQGLTPGYWDIMDLGSYCEDGICPPLYTVFERNAFKWIDPIVIDGAMSVELRDMVISNDGAVILTSNPNEFFTLENRQQTSWDRAIPGHGMLIYHIVYNESTWSSNTANTVKGSLGVQLVSASNKYSASVESVWPTQSFPGTMNVTSFTDDTNPSMKTRAGDPLNLPITNITESNGIIYFDVCGGNISLSAPKLNSSNVNAGGFTIVWEPVAGAIDYVVSVADANGKVLYENEVTGTQFTVDRLNAETTYTANVMARHGDFLSEVTTLEVTTGAFDFLLAVPEILPATNVTETGFTAQWNAVPTATDYLLSVVGITDKEPQTVYTGFGSGSTVTLPEGWTFSLGTKNNYGSSSNGYFGKAAPALKFNAQGAYLSTAVYDDDILTFSCWVRNAGSSTANYFEVTGVDAAGNSTLLLKHGPIVASVGGETVTISDIPAGIHQLVVTFFKVEGGNLALDDVTLTLGGTTEAPIITDQSVGNVTSHNITAPQGKYSYSVVAVNAEGAKSLVSDIASVETGTGSCIDIQVDPTAPVEYYNLQGIRVASPAPGQIYIRRQGATATKIRY